MQANETLKHPTWESKYRFVFPEENPVPKNLAGVAASLSRTGMAEEHDFIERPLLPDHAPKHS